MARAEDVTPQFLDADGWPAPRADEAVAVAHDDGTVEVIEGWQ